MRKISVLLVLVFLSGCTPKAKPVLQSQPNVEVIQDMMESPAIKAQDFDTFDREKMGSRLPPAGTVPQNFKPYPYPTNPDLAAKNLKNPLANDQSPGTLRKGQGKYETYCKVCHGDMGKGDGPVAAKWPGPVPSVVSDKVVGMNDGAIFHVISAGQGIMSSYAFQLVDEKDRWMIVNYIRNLQKINKSQGK